MAVLLRVSRIHGVCGPAGRKPRLAGGLDIARIATGSALLGRGDSGRRRMDAGLLPAGVFFYIVMIAFPQALVAAVTPPPAGAAAALPKTAATSSATLSPQILQQLQNLNLGHKSALAQHAPWLTHTFAGIFALLAVGLIVLLAFQTTKQEGLSGTIGGRVESAYRPRLGFDQQLQRLTSYVAIGFVFFALVLSISGI